MSENAMKNNTQSIDIGESLRSLREARNLSLRSLSELSGLAVNTLSLIENRKTSPSVSTLSKIAKALEIPITAFFDSDTEKSDIGFTAKSASVAVEFKFGKFFDLGSQKTTHPVGPFLILLIPKAYLGIELTSHPGYEFAFCLTGQLEYIIKKKSYRLESGDSLLFDASLPHKWHNPSDYSTQFLLVLYPSKTTDSFTLHHIAEI